MGHAAGLRAGTRVRFIHTILLDEISAAWSWADKLKIVCLLAQLPPEGHDQAVHLPEAVQVSLTGLDGSRKRRSD